MRAVPPWASAIARTIARPEAGAAAGARRVAAGEALERAARDVVCEAWPLVGHRELDASVGRRGDEPDLALPVTQRVVDEVPERLAQRAAGRP